MAPSQAACVDTEVPVFQQDDGTVRGSASWKTPAQQCIFRRAAEFAGREVYVGYIEAPNVTKCHIMTGDYRL